MDQDNTQTAGTDASQDQQTGPEQGQDTPQTAPDQTSIQTGQPQTAAPHLGTATEVVQNFTAVTEQFASTLLSDEQRTAWQNVTQYS